MDALLRDTGAEIVFADDGTAVLKLRTYVGNDDAAAAAVPAEEETMHVRKHWSAAGYALSYTFRRRSVADNVGKIPWPTTSYVDEIVEPPMQYRIRTLRIELPAAILDDDIAAVRAALGDDVGHYPAYSKFHVVLQCSAAYKDEEEGEVDEPRNDVRRLVTRRIESILAENRRDPTDRDYIWFMADQMTRAQLAHDSGYSSEECWSYLRKCRPTGKEHYAKCNDDDWF